MYAYFIYLYIEYTGMFCVLRDFSDNDIIGNNLKKIHYSNDEINTMLLDTECFIEKNLESYSKQANNILYQFNLDFPRSLVYFNEYQIKSITEFTSIFSALPFNYNEIPITEILMMLCNQSSYATPYMFLSKLFCKTMILCSDSENRAVKIYYDEYYSNLTFRLEGQFKLIDNIDFKSVGVIEFDLTVSTNIIKNKTSLLYLYYYDVYNVNGANIFTKNITFNWRLKMD
jgi:hypothetical protein